jgi:nitric oxide dioxygenase
LNPIQIKLVQDSFAKVLPIAERAGTMFYERLFAIAPEVIPLFRRDKVEQGKMLMATLAVVVNGLDQLESVLPVASVIAKKHVDYGVKAEHYAPVGAALLWTLQQGLGPAWSPALKQAWTAAYDTLSGYMISEAYGAAKAAE